MLKINPNNNFVFKPRMESQGNGEKEIKTGTTTYEPTAPKPMEVVDIDNPDTPL